MGWGGRSKDPICLPSQPSQPSHACTHACAPAPVAQPPPRPHAVHAQGVAPPGRARRAAVRHAGAPRHGCGVWVAASALLAGGTLLRCCYWRRPCCMPRRARGSLCCAAFACRGVMRPSPPGHHLIFLCRRPDEGQLCGRRGPSGLVLLRPPRLRRPAPRQGRVRAPRLCVSLFCFGPPLAAGLRSLVGLPAWLRVLLAAPLTASRPCCARPACRPGGSSGGGAGAHNLREYGRWVLRCTLLAAPLRAGLGCPMRWRPRRRPVRCLLHPSLRCTELCCAPLRATPHCFLSCAAGGASGITGSGACTSGAWAWAPAAARWGACNVAGRWVRMRAGEASVLLAAALPETLLPTRSRPPWAPSLLGACRFQAHYRPFNSG